MLPSRTTWQFIRSVSRSICIVDLESRTILQSDGFALDSALSRSGIEEKRGSVPVPFFHFTYQRYYVGMCWFAWYSCIAQNLFTAFSLLSYSFSIQVISMFFNLLILAFWFDFEITKFNYFEKEKIFLRPNKCKLNKEFYCCHRKLLYFKPHSNFRQEY